MYTFLEVVYIIVYVCKLIDYLFHVIEKILFVVDCWNSTELGIQFSRVLSVLKYENLRIVQDLLCF